MFIVYSKPNCTLCEQAKNLLVSKGMAFREIYFDVGQPKREGAEYVNVSEFKAKYPEAKTAPQIFVEEGDSVAHVGSFNDLRTRLC
jgi:glutaredoxin